MEQEFKILFVEDVSSDVELMERELLNGGLQFTSRHVDSREDFLETLENFSPDIVICDNSLPRFDSVSAMQIIRETNKDIPFLLVTGTLSDEDAVVRLNMGAYDYVLKTNLKRLPYSIKNALSKSRMAKEKQHIRFENEQLQRNNQEIQSKNQDFTDSMVYAKGIQNALLPSSNYIQKYFPESFLINLPKHIVSGDFYWFSEYNGKFVVAVGDCTGHGVPAALISMMGYNKLNHIVNIMGTTDPASILEHLNSSIRESFRQDSQESTIRDGMDIAICTIDKKNNTLEFAGANRPLYCIRNSELEIIKGDKKCIGGIWDASASEKSFSSHTLAMDSLDSFYLFTDGFIDQFGGAFGKKFLCKRFKKLLSSGQRHTMNEQRELLANTLAEWKGDEEQTDDICVLGIRF